MTSNIELTHIHPMLIGMTLFLERVKVDFTYNSNKLEGITLSYGQTIKLLKDFVTPQNAAPGEIFDLVNHQRILDNIFKNYRSENLSVENIKTLHQDLMKILHNGMTIVYIVREDSNFLKTLLPEATEAFMHICSRLKLRQP